MVLRHIQQRITSKLSTVLRLVKKQSLHLLFHILHFEFLIYSIYFTSSIPYFYSLFLFHLHIYFPHIPHPGDVSLTNYGFSMVGLKGRKQSTDIKQSTDTTGEKQSASKNSSLKSSSPTGPTGSPPGLIAPTGPTGVTVTGRSPSCDRLSSRVKSFEDRSSRSKTSRSEMIAVAERSALSMSRRFFCQMQYECYFQECYEFQQCQGLF